MCQKTVFNPNLDIRGDPERLLFIRNCPPCDVIVIPDDQGFVYIYKVTESELTFYDMIKHNSSKEPYLDTVF